MQSHSRNSVCLKAKLLISKLEIMLSTLAIQFPSKQLIRFLSRFVPATGHRFVIIGNDANDTKYKLKRFTSQHKDRLGYQCSECKTLLQKWIGAFVNTNLEPKS